MPCHNENDTISFWEMVSLVSCILQIASYFLVLQQASNDDILKEIRNDMEQHRQEHEELKRMLKEHYARRADDTADTLAVQEIPAAED